MQEPQPSSMTGRAAQLRATPATVAVFLVPDWEIEWAVASDSRLCPPSCTGWRTGTTTRRHSRLHPPVRE